MPEVTSRGQLETVVYPLTSAPADYDPLLALVGNARFVLLGEASHGTHEFCRERAQITKRLMPFDAVLHFDETRVVEPLERTSTWEKGEVPETFPSGL